jgi:hypothetical protein
MTKKLTARQEGLVARKTLRESSTGAHTVFNRDEGQTEVLKQPTRSSSIVGGTLPAQYASTVTTSRTTTANTTNNRAKSATPQHSYVTPAAPRQSNVLRSDVTQLSGPTAAASQLQSKYQRVVNSATKSNVLANMKINQQNLGSQYSAAAESTLERVEQQASANIAPVTRTRPIPATSTATSTTNVTTTNAQPRRRYVPANQQQ